MKINDRIRLMAFDMDGTLLNSETRIPEENMEALLEAENRGIQIALISGRMFESMRKFVIGTGLHPIISCMNGALIEWGAYGPKISENTFDPDTGARVLRVMRESGMFFTTYTWGVRYMGNPQVRFSLGERFSYPVTIEEDPIYPYETTDDQQRLEEACRQGVYKFVVMGAQYDPGFERIAEKLAYLDLSVSKASRRNLEFMPHGIDKGYALKKIMEMQNLKPDQVMAFGDQTNDLPMLRAAGFPVAMANGEEIVRQTARIVAPDHNDCGVAKIIRRFVLGDEEL